jgi:hypothetical protein
VSCPGGLAAATLALACALLLSACGKEKHTLAPVCVEADAPILTALEAAPGTVTLRGGVRLSDCVDDARSDADLQTLGLLYGDVARKLAERAGGSNRAATRLGYLIGAVRRGAAHSNGIHAELVRRLEQTPGIGGPAPARRSAFERGLAAGERRG